LGDVVEIRSGWGFPHAYQGQSEGIYPFYKVSDMNLVGNETVMVAANNFIDSATAKKLGVAPAPAGTVIFPKIGAAVATNKKRLLSMPSAYDNNVMGLIPGEPLNPRFLFFWMQTVNLIKLAHNSGAVPSIRKTEMERLLVPVPPLEEQHRIVAILDKFDALVNDLSSGLPAEIKARRQQYEYYRDRLLGFREAA
jgi:type I restriction enzyme S subunit